MKQELKKSIDEIKQDLERHYVKKKMCRNGPLCPKLYSYPFKCSYGHTDYEYDLAVPYRNRKEDVAFSYIEAAKIEEEVDYYDVSDIRNKWIR